MVDAVFVVGFSFEEYFKWGVWGVGVKNLGFVGEGAAGVYYEVGLRFGFADIGAKGFVFFFVN